MKSLIKYSIWIVFLCIIVSSCGEYPCGKASSYIALISFTINESDTIIVRRFTKGNNFISVKDTVRIDNSNANFQHNGDTILVLGGSFNDNLNGNFTITSEYDFEIYFPKINRVYKVTDIIEPQEYGRSSTRKDYCINEITSYKINGQLVNSGNFFSRIYIKK